MLALASIILFAFQAAAQEAPAAAAVMPAPDANVAMEVKAEPTCCTVAALTIVELEILDEASSRTSLIGQKVRIRTAAPLSVDGKIVVPEGTEGLAEVIQASKARMMGKGGELVLGLPFLELNGQRIPLKRMRFGPSTGKGNDMLTTVAVASIGLPGLLISGGNVDIAKGARANAVVTNDTFIWSQP